MPYGIPRLDLSKIITQLEGGKGGKGEEEVGIIISLGSWVRHFILTESLTHWFDSLVWGGGWGESSVID